MPGLYKDEGIVLKTIKLGEADRIVTLFTRGHGKVRAVAKGIRKTKSRFGARLEPFTRVALLIYQGRNLDTITQADIVRSFTEVRSEFPRLTSAAAIVDAVEKFTPEREQAPSIYSLLVSALDALVTGPIDTVVPAFMTKLLSVAGYHPHLTTCAACGDPDVIAFSAPLGGAVCELCRRQEPGAGIIGSDRIALIGRLLVSDFGYPADRAAVHAITSALKAYAEYHVERPLRGLDFLVAT
jgi:DNA repair protein RecO (recombination protein O)